MKHTCENVKELLSLYIDELLCDDERDAVFAHLETCADCRSEYEFLSGIVKTAKTMPTLSVSEELHANIMQTIAGQTKAKPVKRSLWRMASGFVAAAAVIAISLISLDSLPGHPDLTTEPTPKVTATAAPVTETAEPAEKTDTTPVITLPPSRPQEAVSPTPAALQEPVVPAAEDIPAAPASMAVEEPVYTGDENPQPEARSFSGSRAEETVSCYYIGEESYEEAVLILDANEFDGLAYLVPVGEKEAVCGKLESLSGYVRHTGEQSDADFLRITLVCE